MLALLIAGLVGGGAFALRSAARPPAPQDLALPAGDQVVAVAGACWGGGNELFRCESGSTGVRSILTVGSGSAPEHQRRRLHEFLATQGFRPSQYGFSRNEFAARGFPVDRDPELLCRPLTGGSECIALLKPTTAQYQLAYYPRASQ